MIKKSAHCYKWQLSCNSDILQKNIFHGTRFKYRVSSIGSFEQKHCQLSLNYLLFPLVHISGPLVPRTSPWIRCVRIIKLSQSRTVRPNEEKSHYLLPKGVAATAARPDARPEAQLLAASPCCPGLRLLWKTFSKPNLIDVWISNVSLDMRIVSSGCRLGIRSSCSSFARAVSGC